MRWIVPLISGHQRPAAAGDFRPPRIICGQGQDTRAHSSWPSPGPPGTTNKVTGSRGWFYLLSDMLLAEGMADMIMRVRMGELLGDMGWRRGQVSGGAPT